MKSDEEHDIELINLWTSTILNGFVSSSTRDAVSPTTTIAFGRGTTKKNEGTTDIHDSCKSAPLKANQSPKDKVSRVSTLSVHGNVTDRPRMSDAASFQRPTKQSRSLLQQANGAANIRAMLMSPQDNKHRGRQISDTKLI